MKRCYGCFEQIDDNQIRCPLCGYVEGSPLKDPAFLVPGTVLSGRYKIGAVIENDDSTVTYAAWDNASSIKVRIKEFLPTKFVTRVPGSTFVVPFDDNRDALFDNGFKAFVNEANRIYAQGGSEKLYDCIGENNTAYMIFEWTAKKAGGPFKPAPSAASSAPARSTTAASTSARSATASSAPARSATATSAPARSAQAAPASAQVPVRAPARAQAQTAATARPVVNSSPVRNEPSGYRGSSTAAPVPAPAVQKKQDDGFAGKIARLPVWLKVLAPVVLVALIVVPIVIISSLSKKNKKPEESKKPAVETTEQTTTSETETTATETEPTEETTETTLPPTGWQGSDAGGWRYYPAAGEFYKDSWEEIAGEWYYFNSEGFMERGCYRDGYWINKDGTRDSESDGEWKEDDGGEWYEDNGWYPSDMGLWIDGKYYWFGSDGYLDPEITSPEEAARLQEADEDNEDGDSEE